VADLTHLIVTADAPDGFYGESPQLPGFAMMRPTQTEFLRDYQRVLSEAGARGEVRAHYQVRVLSEDGHECLIRWQQGPGEEARREVARRVELIIGDNAREPSFLEDVERTPTGEIAFVAVAPDDTLGDVIGQMWDERDAIVLCAAVADRGVWCQQMISQSHDDHDRWASLAERGWTPETTISQVLLDSAKGLPEDEDLVVDPVVLSV
jgi:hypothetical protein